ncbi:MAG: transglycosylase domain-containing protein [Myxococcota bacterium]
MRSTESTPGVSARLLSWGIRGCVVLAVLVGLAGIGLHGLGVWFEGDLPPVKSVTDYRKAALQTTRVFARDGRLVAELWRERRTLVTGRDIPDHVRQVAVAAEDGDFYTHDGVDLLGIARAMLINLRDQRFSQGASTITQQLARSFYLTADKTLQRKVREVFLARKLETHLSKDEILTLYLNQIYFGHGRWGIAEASRYYLGKRVAELTVPDAALLMALVPAPERLNPKVALQECLKRRNRIIDRMVSQGYTEASEAAIFRQERPELVDGSRRTPSADWFVDVVKRRLIEALGRDVVMSGGLSVYTTLDLDAQASVDAAVKRHLGDAPSAPQGAVVVLEAGSHAVRAISGGANFKESVFNRAIQAHRQAGSTVKPFVYGSALERGLLTDESELPNSARCYRGAKRPWCPKNAGGKHDDQPTSVSDALTRSLNVIAVQVLQKVGISAFTDFMRRAGVRSAVPSNLTAALGSGEVTPLELTNAYATLASQGVHGEPVFVSRVEDVGGRTVYAERSSPRQAIRRDVAGSLTQMLTRVVAEGTGRRAAVKGLKVAGKTGTTNGRVDAWFVGFTVPKAREASIVTGVWVGHDDNKPLVSGSGGTTAAPLWADVMRGWMSPSGQQASLR